MMESVNFSEPALLFQGQIVVDKAAFVTESNVLTSDGVLHVTDKLLIPDDIEPLLPRYCNGKKFSNVSRERI